jgi:hypothetical protein
LFLNNVAEILSTVGIDEHTLSSTEEEKVIAMVGSFKHVPPLERGFGITLEALMKEVEVAGNASSTVISSEKMA